MTYAYQVISYNKNAHVCHDQIRHLGYFKTRSSAQDFADKQPDYGGEIIIRSSRVYSD